MSRGYFTEAAPVAPPKLCPRCGENELPERAIICDDCQEEIDEDAEPDGRWVNTPHGMIYE